MRQKAENERRCGRTIFLTDRVCSNTTLCKLGVPSKKFSITKGFRDFKGGKIRQKVESKSMAKNEHLRSVFDWIQIQFDKTEFSPREIIEDHSIF